jgi:hypothetical protein
MTIANRSDVAPDSSHLASVVRSVNDRIRELARLIAGDDEWQFLCECGRPDCHELVSLTLSGYAAYRVRLGSPALLCVRHDLRES